MTCHSTKNGAGRKVALITGAAKRIGREIALELHAQNVDIAIHYRDSQRAAISLNQTLNNKRTNSACIFNANLLEPSAGEQLVMATIARFKRLDFLVNNASIFYPTPILLTDDEQVGQFVTSNSLQPANLIRQAAPYLKQTSGAIVNLLDIYADRGLAEHTLYVASKDILTRFTKQFAGSLAPNIRVNGVSPGAILWPTQDLGNSHKQSDIVENSALKMIGKAEDISRTVCFLLLDASYITGAVIKVDGGRSLYV